jgi:hypothetical protein
MVVAVTEHLALIGQKDVMASDVITVHGVEAAGGDEDDQDHDPLAGGHLQHMDDVALLRDGDVAGEVEGPGQVEAAEEGDAQHAELHLSAQGAPEGPPRRPSLAELRLS